MQCFLIASYEMTFDRESSFGYMTNWAARLFARAIEAELRPHGLSSGHMPVFFALGDGDELPQKELAARAEIEQPTMAATLSRMERDGLVERRPDPNDGRVAQYRLTPRAMALVPAVRAAVGTINTRATQDWSREERKCYLTLLKRVTLALRG